MKEFNITGSCFPDQHYMVDIGNRLERVKSLIDDGKYFCINRGRQFGKSTTLEAVASDLADKYFVIFLSFEGVGDAAFDGDTAFVLTFASKLKELIDEGVWADPQGDFTALLADLTKMPMEEREAMMRCASFIGKLVRAIPKPVVLLIDEVDQAGNHDSFIHFLALLRDRYLKRKRFATFQSVILAGVYDIKNLKLKIRDPEEHQYNSPWNIAAPFDEDMTLSEEGIAGMLRDYENDHHTGMDIALIAKLVRDYTGGYPFLVSRLCMLMDEQQNEKLKIENGKCGDGEGVGGWNKEGFLAAVKAVLKEKSTLFDDLIKKLDQFPRMHDMLASILFNGEDIAFSAYTKEIDLASMFSIIRDRNGKVAIHNRIFEIWLYNAFSSEMEMENRLYRNAAIEKPFFVKTDHTLDMPLILKRFAETFNDIYGDRDDRFREDEGRRYFMLYIKPIINGVGNYYIEAETRDGTRTDMVIDYCGRRYVIEMKIWRGESYNQRGEEQLAKYLDYFKLDTGYMVSFCFNKNKAPGLKDPIQVGTRTLVEVVV